MVLKHATASVFVFGLLPRGWRIGLIRHPRFGRAMLPGGHVEPDESQGEAALREVAEETGLRARLLAPPSAPVPAALATLAAAPWWIVEYPTPADGHAAGAHVHVDHLYVAVAEDPAPAARAAHPFGWHAAGELPGLAMFDDTRAVALAMLDGLRRLPGWDGSAGLGEVTAAVVAGLGG